MSRDHSTATALVQPLLRVQGRLSLSGAWNLQEYKNDGTSEDLLLERRKLKARACPPVRRKLKARACPPVRDESAENVSGAIQREMKKPKAPKPPSDTDEETQPAAPSPKRKASVNTQQVSNAKRQKPAPTCKGKGEGERTSRSTRKQKQPAAERTPEYPRKFSEAPAVLGSEEGRKDFAAMFGIPYGNEDRAKAMPEMGTYVQQPEEELEQELEQRLEQAAVPNATEAPSGTGAFQEAQEEVVKEAKPEDELSDVDEDAIREGPPEGALSDITEELDEVQQTPSNARPARARRGVGLSKPSHTSASHSQANNQTSTGSRHGQVSPPESSAIADLQAHARDGLLPIPDQIIEESTKVLDKARKHKPAAKRKSSAIRDRGPVRKAASKTPSESEDEEGEREEDGSQEDHEE